MLPAVAIGATVPLLATGAFGGYVNHINIILPSVARRSKQSLMAFAARAPPETRLQIKSMWFMPWPYTKQVFLGDLRRLPYSQLRLTNLEHIPVATMEAHKKAPIYSWVVRMLMGRYWVSRQQVKDRSRVPGVWDRMWEQIPMVGEEAPKRRAERVAYTIANRGLAVGGAPTPKAPSPSPFAEQKKAP
jgi:hypothetical protein